MDNLWNRSSICIFIVGYSSSKLFRLTFVDVAYFRSSADRSYEVRHLSKLALFTLVDKIIGGIHFDTLKQVRMERNRWVRTALSAMCNRHFQREKQMFLLENVDTIERE